jgi:hypothetical protein
MIRSTLLSTALIVMLGGVAAAQEINDRPLLGERLNQFRKALLGDPQETMPPMNSPAPPAGSSTTRQNIPRVPTTSRPGVGASASNKTTGRVTPTVPKTSTPSTASSGPQSRKLFDPFDDAKPASESAATPKRETQPVERIASAPKTETAPSSRRRVTADSGNSLSDSFTAKSSEPTVAKPSPVRSGDELAPRVAKAEKLFEPVSVPTGSGAGDRVLITRKSPVLSVETSGPQKIVVGKESTYIVAMKNSGDQSAAEVVVFISVPAWAEVVEAKGADEAVTSSVERTADGVLWKIGALAGNSHQNLHLKIVPRKSQSFDLAVRWASSPVTSQATVEVQEAKLQMVISGPSEVVFGQQQLYKLTLVNPGNADAENVTLFLSPLTPGDGPVASHKVGTLRAGASTSVEIELTARQAGKLAIKAEATADGDLKTAASEEVMVRRAALQVAVTGPKVHYAGVPAHYDIRVTNAGDAPARHVTVAATLPGTAELVTASQEGQSLARNGEVSWSIDQLAPGSEQVFTVRCALKSPGANRVEALVTADGDLKGTNHVNTQLMALADLVLSVGDSAGPVAVGQDAVYEVRIRNRGTSGAEAIEMVAFFSPGVEAVSVEGGPHEIASGAVIFKPLTSLAAGAEAVYKIKARAATAGNHRIRVELECKSLGTRLCQEDTTLFYGEEGTAAATRNANSQ